MSTDRAASATGVTGSARGTNNENKPAHVRAFQEKLGDAAEEAEQATGVPAKFMLGQAALETGWGKRMIRNADGSNSNNLFGIKAGPDWKGKVANAVTTEYVNGKAHTKVEKFRSYDSHADAFKDYARMIGNNPRYEKVLQHGGDASTFAHGLQRAGYATDPQYAAKLSRIIKHSLA
jgi:flagellar protein FlgJ